DPAGHLDVEGVGSVGVGRRPGDLLGDTDRPGAQVHAHGVRGQPLDRLLAALVHVGVLHAELVPGHGVGRRHDAGGAARVVVGGDDVAGAEGDVDEVAGPQGTGGGPGEVEGDAQP